MEDCVPDSHDISNPQIYTIIFHILTAIIIPIHVYGAYCIFYKTPLAMNSVKWLVLNCHVLNFLLDLSISLLSIPYIFHPTFSGISLGLLDFSELEVYLVLTLIALVTVSMWSLLENRYHILFGANENPLWCWLRKPMTLINYSSALTYFAVPYLALPDQNEAFWKIRDTLPCHLEQSYNGRKVFILSSGQHLPLYCIIFIFFLAMGQIIPLFFIVITKLILQSRKKQCAVSQRTLKMRRKLVVALMVQSVSPLLLISFPVEYIGVSTSLAYYNNILNRMTMIFLSLHGVSSTLTMIFVHQPYREATVDYIYWMLRWERKREDSRKISAFPAATQF